MKFWAFVDRIWLALGSVKLTLVVFVALLLLSIPGTIVLQENVSGIDPGLQYDYDFWQVGQWLGLFRASSIRRVPGGVRFVVRRGDGYEAGFIYLPEVQQTNAFSTYRPVGGGWWTWWEEVP